MNINFRNTQFLRTLILGLLSLNGNGRGVCIRTYVYLSMYKINFGSYVRTAQFATVRKLEYGTPLQVSPLLKKMTRQQLNCFGVQFILAYVYSDIPIKILPFGLIHQKKKLTRKTHSNSNIQYNKRAGPIEYV